MKDLKNLEIFIEPPIIRNGIETVYLGIYDRIFHHLPQSEYRSSYASLLSDLLNGVDPQLNNVVIGRLDADDNRNLLEQLDSDYVYNIQVIEPGDYKRVPFWRKIFRRFMADPMQPWIFFQTKTQSYLKQVLEKYWFCYAGSWTFLISKQYFSIDQWRCIKETMNYILTDVVEKLSPNYRCSIVITDDHEIHFCMPRTHFEEIYHCIKATFLRHGFQLVEKEYAKKGSIKNVRHEACKGNEGADDL